MYNNHKIMAVIPARAHNDKIDKLNLKNLGCKPLITHTIDEANKSQYIDEIYVSTEDDDIANISKEHDAVVPFLRPIELSQSGVTTDDVVRHVVTHIGKKFDIVITLLPNAPFRSAEIIDDAIGFMLSNNYERVVGIQKQADSYLYLENNAYNPLNSEYGITEDKFMTIFRYGGGILLNTAHAIFIDSNKNLNCGYYLIHEHNARLIRSIYDLIIAERLIHLHPSLVDSLIKAT